MPSSPRLGVRHHDHRGGAVVERAGVAGGDLAVGPEHRLAGWPASRRWCPGRGPSSLVTTVAVGQRDRGDLPVEEAALLGGDGPLLGPGGELVHLLAADVLVLGHVLGGLAHGDVDVGQAGGRRPRALAPPAGAVGARSPASSNSGFFGPSSAMPNWNRLDVSTPPATNTSPSPALMAWAAMRIVCSDDEQ